MKKIAILSAALLLSFTSFSQAPEEYNFYSMMDSLYENDPSVLIDDSLKNGVGREIDRINLIWGPRLSPHGKASIATAANVNHVNQFNTQGVGNSSCGQITANWKEEGPFDNAKYPGGGNGQINRITFDPQYNLTTNTVYGASFYGGLWRSQNGGADWSVVNTDQQLPQTSVSGIAVSYQDTNDLFICTGSGDGVYFDKLQGGQGNARTTPILTSGIYRSLDYGGTWTAINDGFLTHFVNGGTCRNILVDPTDANNIFVISSEGIFKTINGLAPTPTWSKLTTITGISEDFNGLKLHPANSNVIYASSDDIIKSTNKGVTWNSMTGATTGLDFTALPDSFQVIRIKLEVTPADTTRLYAYIIGGEQVNGVHRKVIYIYQFKNGSWSKIYYSQNPLQGSTPQPKSSNIGVSYMGFAVSTVDPDELYFGNISLYQFYDITTPLFSPHVNEPHDDIHDMVFEPNKAVPNVFVGSHGGVSIGLQRPNVPYLSRKFVSSSKGINTSLIWSLDVSNVDKDVMIMGRQDNGTHMTTTGASNEWSIALHGYGSGDGYGVAIANDLDNSRQQFYISSSERSSLQSPYDAYTVSIDPSQNGDSHIREYVPVNFKVKEHPLSNKPIFGLSELYAEADTLVTPFSKDSWQIQSDIYSDTLWKDTWKRQIVDFDIAPSNPDYVYMATYGRRGNYETDLFRSTTGLSNGQYLYSYSGAPSQPNAKFIPITGNLPTINYNGVNYDPYVTGIAVSPINHMDVWVSVSGFQSNFKVFKSSNGGVTWTNADTNACLPNLPTNGIEYQNGTDDRLYLAMDDGVYVTDGSMNGEWKRFGNLPNTMVNTMFMNSCSNTLYVGTYGRGIWSTKLLPRSGDASALIIDTNTIWTENRFVQTDILVKAGNKLTITSTIYMPANGKIIVEPKAILEVDGGTITNSCGNSWDGISLEGSNAHDQFPLTHPTNQAKLELKNNALLDNVQYAIKFGKDGQWNDFGGLVEAEDATIKVTRRAASFYTYPYTNHSYFKRCTFEYAAGISEPPLSLVTIWDNDGLNFQGCTFVDNSGINEYSPAIGNGIYSIDASYSVGPDCNFPPNVPGYLPCPTQYFTKSSFTNLNQGIYVANAGGTPTINVSESNFYDNSMAMRVDAVDNVRFVLNTILTGGLVKQGYNGIISDYQVGFYSNDATGYEIEQNTFEERSSALEPVAGVNIISSGAVANEVYNNTFKYNTIGEKYDGLNRNPPLSAIEGLQFLCNDNLTGNDKDVEIDQINDPLHGIRDNQGSSTPANSASNLFINSGNLNIENNTFNNLAYHYNSAVPSEYPPQVTPGLVSRINVGVSNTCPDRFWNTGQTGGVIVEPFNSAFQGIVDEYYEDRKQYNDLLYTYFQNIDNGNTDSLLTAIGLYFPGDAQIMRNDLMQESPFLSEQALRDAAQTGILTDALLLEVCLANPDATNNEGFLDFVEYEIPNPLPANMVQLIYQSWGGETPRTILENQLADVNAELGRVSSKLIHIYEIDSLDHTDSVRSMIESQKTLDSKYKLVELEVELGEFTNALTQLTAIQTNNTLNAEQLAEHANLVDYVNFRKDVQTEGIDYMRLDESKLTELRTIASANTGRSALLAQNILCFGYHECDYGSAPPETRLKSRRTYHTNPIVDNAINTSIEVTLSPNPATSKVKITLDGLADGQAVQLSVKNTSGQLVLQKQLKVTVTNLAIDQLTKGVYLYEISSGKESISTGKLIVQ